MVAVATLMSTAGCLDHCGPTLDSLHFRVDFQGGLTEANRSIARNALESMGYTYTSGGSGGFNMVQGSVAVFIGDRNDNDQRTTEFTYKQDLPNQEYDSSDRAEAEGYTAARKHWPEFNATVSEFKRKTGWTAGDQAWVDPAVYIC